MSNIPQPKYNIGDKVYAVMSQSRDEMCKECGQPIYGEPHWFVRDLEVRGVVIRFGRFDEEDVFEISYNVPYPYPFTDFIMTEDELHATQEEAEAAIKRKVG